MPKKKWNFDDVFEKLQSKFPSKEDVEMLDTGSSSLNEILGGGFPLAKYIELHSPEGLGKTTIALDLARSLAAMGRRTVFIDSEKALNRALLESMGLLEYVRNHMIVIHKINTYEDIQEVLDGYLDVASEFSLIIVDSITSILPNKQIEGDIQSVLPGLRSRLQGQLLEKYRCFTFANDISILWLNQMRMTFNFRGQAKKKRAGSNALGYYCDIILGLRKIKDIKDGTKTIGYELEIEAEKNKFVPPNAAFPIHLLFGKGISRIREIIQEMTDLGLMIQKGPYYYLTCLPKDQGFPPHFQGEARAVEFIEDNYALVRKHLDEAKAKAKEPEVEEEAPAGPPAPVSLDELD